MLCITEINISHSLLNASASYDSTAAANRELAAAFNIASVPAVKLFVHGEVVMSLLRGCRRVDRVPG
jgi:hypothetical protein